MEINKTGKTAVILTYPGIGDIIWHLPFLHGIAKKSDLGEISLYTRKKNVLYFHYYLHHHGRICFYINFVFIS